MSILIVAAHPDDEVLGCGGTIARLSEQGQDIFIAIVGEGATSRYSNRNDSGESLVDSLYEQGQKVGKLLGAKNVFHFGLPDNRFDTVPLLEIVRIVEKLIDELQPDTIYTHHGGDLNIDHAMIFRAVLTATRPIMGSVVRTLYSFEIPSSSEWSFSRLSPVFCPNTFIDISSSIEKKIEAMSIYESEIRSFPHPRSPEGLRSISKRWGSVAGLMSAEAFELIRNVF